MLEVNRIYCKEAVPFFAELDKDCVDLLVTSPPYSNMKEGAGLMQSKSDYLNIPPEKYVEWFDPIARGIYRTLKPHGSFILNIDTFIRDGVMDLYIYDLLLHLIRKVGFKFVCDYYWIKSSQLPSGRASYYKGPRRGVEQVWHFTKSIDYKIDTRNVLMAYSKGMMDQMKEYSRRQVDGMVVMPSGHNYKKDRMLQNNGGSTPFNYLVVPTSGSNETYMEKWKEMNLPVHPCRYPNGLVEFFVRMLTDPGDLVADCFMGSGTTAHVAKLLSRNYIGCDRADVYCKAAEVRLAMVKNVQTKKKSTATTLDDMIKDQPSPQATL